VGIEDGFGVSAFQPGAGSEIERCHGIAEGNPTCSMPTSRGRPIAARHRSSMAPRKATRISCSDTALAFRSDAQLRTALTVLGCAWWRSFVRLNLRQDQRHPQRQ
jgi:hypothetical protein